MVHRKALAQRILLELDELEQVNAVIVRHWTLDAARIGPLVESLRRTWRQARTELLAFVNFPERLETGD